MGDKRICHECNWVGDKSQVLTAPHPFVAGYIIEGCPNCREAESMRVGCDEPDCEFEATCGFHTPEGYRNTCGKHYRKYKEEHHET